MSNYKPIFALLIGCVILTAGLAYLATGGQTEELALDPDADAISAPLTAKELEIYEADITNTMNPIAVLETTMGVIKIELFKDTMPITSGNFEKLVSEGFYDNTKFHRVIEGFMIQGGDPISKTEEVFRYGTGGPGYAIADEHIVGDLLTNTRGTISMANSGPNSGGSQFFINLIDNTNLDFNKQPLSSKHPVFGRVVEGMDVVDAIGTTETNERDLPVEPVVVTKVTIEAGT